MLRLNRRTGYAAWAGLPFDFTCPSLSGYPFQWFWDSCFNAIVLRHFDIERAKRELLTLMSAARGDGFIPHVIFWESGAFPSHVRRYAIARDGHTSASIQPPVLAQAVAAIWDSSQDRAFLDAILPKLWRFHRWLIENRDPDGDGLISIVQPDESGMDASPRYDRLMKLPQLTRSGYREAMRRLFRVYRAARAEGREPLDLDAFSVEDVAVNAIFAEGCRSLARLSLAAGAAAAGEEFASQSRRTSQALLAKCWDPRRGLFFDLAGRDERPESIAAVASLMPLILPDLPSEIATRLVEEHLLNPEEFWPPYPVPSVALNEPSFMPGRGPLWRGPTWINTNWWLARGLRAHGYEGAAQELTARTAALVSRSGFREYYNPLTGAGYGARGFAWSTLVVDMLQSP